jgi:hypothetical protein
MDTVSFNNRDFGIITVEESDEKPIICTKNYRDILREGAIYYRYRGETKEIKYAELHKILESEKEKERILWIKHIEKISIVGPRHIHLLDSYKGELSLGDKTVLLDNNIIDQLNFIKEGHFTEKEGEGLPTLKLIGNVEGVNTDDIVAKPDVIYPLTTTDLQMRLNLNQHEIRAIIYTLDIKSKAKYHADISVGKSSSVHKYTESLIPLIERMLQRSNFLSECKEKYQEYLKNNKSLGKRKHR